MKRVEDGGTKQTRGVSDCASVTKFSSGSCQGFVASRCVELDLECLDNL
jgi:hypothetical protein